MSNKVVVEIIDNKEIVFRKTKKFIINGKEISTNQATLFSEIWEQAPKIEVPKEKRQHYKNPTYNKEYKNDTIIQTEKVSNQKQEELTQIVKDDFATWTKLRTILKDLTPFALIIYKEEKYKKNPFNIELNDDLFNVCSTILQTTVNIQDSLTVWKDFLEFDTNEKDVNIWETEIIGTEDFHISERLYLHETLLNALKGGIPLQEAMVDIRFLINLLKKGYTLNQSKYVLKTIKER
jgi:hypothetical protein